MASFQQDCVYLTTLQLKSSIFCLHLIHKESKENVLLLHCNSSLHKLWVRFPPYATGVTAHSKHRWDRESLFLAGGLLLEGDVQFHPRPTRLSDQVLWSRGWCAPKTLINWQPARQEESPDGWQSATGVSWSPSVPPLGNLAATSRLQSCPGRQYCSTISDQNHWFVSPSDKQHQKMWNFV